MTQTVFQDKAFASLGHGIGRFYANGQFSDLVVTIGNINFSCHRLVLAAVSDFFQSSVTSPSQDSSTGFVHIDHKDVTGESFRLLLDSIYKGKDVVTMETVRVVLKMSIFLRVKFLQEYCEQYLSDNMSPETYLGMWQFAENNQLMSLANNAASMAASRFDEVAKCGELVQLPKAMLLTLLSFQKKVRMDDLCRAIFRWAEEHVEERKRHLGELLPFVDFTQLSPSCLIELTKYFNHPFREYIIDFISEGMTFKLKDLERYDVQTQRQTRVQQGPCFIYNIPGMTKCAVIVGGWYRKGKPLKNVTAIPINAKSLYKTYALKNMPEACGLDFATCVWRNELYVSGGSMQPKYFAVYKPGDDVWETLPSLPQESEKHNMAAIDWTIYVLGGVSQSQEAGKRPVKDILSYNTKVKVWKNFSFLQTEVKDATSATLGHRIYVFGGQDVTGHSTDMVQCVNTLTGCVYTAGRLPSPTFGARALSNGGTIFVTRPDGDVLQMKENIFFAEQVEKTLAEKKTKMGLDSTSTEGHCFTPSEQGDSAKSTMDNMENAADNTNIVHFKAVGTFLTRQHYGAFLQEESVVVCGGEANDGTFLNEMVEVNYRDGTAKNKLRKLIHRMACFGLHVLNVSEDFLLDDKASEQPLDVGDKVKLKYFGTNIFISSDILRKLHNRNLEDVTGIIKAKYGDSSWSVIFEGLGTLNIPSNNLQLCE